MRGFVIGVDGGGTKTEAVVVDSEGRILGRGHGGASNPYLVGWTNTMAEIRTAVINAASDAGIDVTQAAAITLALAGVDRPAERKTLWRLAHVAWPQIPVRVENDALAALVGGTGTKYGIVVIAGTGMIAYGVNSEGTEARAGGWGRHVDRGSAYAIGIEAIRAVLAGVDGTGMATCLTDSLLKHLGMITAEDLLPWVHEHADQTEKIAKLAPLVIACAQDGDTVAADILAQGADALAHAAWTVARHLNLDKGPFPIVLTGGLLHNHPFFWNVVTQAIQTRLPSTTPTPPAHSAAVGAAYLAWEYIGHTIVLEHSMPPEGERVWATEQPNVLTRHLDMRTPLEIVGLMHVEDKRAVHTIHPALPTIAAAVEAIVPRMLRGGRLIYIGAGTPGRLGIVDASECPPTFGVSPERVIGIIAGGKEALFSAQEGAEDDEPAGRQDIASLGIGELDTVVGLSASGRTPYVIGALQEARARGALTIAIVCNAQTPMDSEAELVIHLPVGPEVIAGSTRLKAGTAQKLVLNMLSTAVMVHMGKVYDNLMVDVQPANQKLRTRAQRILATACGIDEEAAREALERSNWNVKVALVSTLLECSPEEARTRLQEANGHVRVALQPSQEQTRP